MATGPLLTGSELVLVAEVPKAGGRWKQVHFNMAVSEQFFRLAEGEGKTVRLEKVDRFGDVVLESDRPLVFSERNKNSKIEFDFSPIRDYPEAGAPLLIVLEIGLRHFRYLLLLPGDAGYKEMRDLNSAKPSVGRGARRIITNLDEVELRWPGCPLRGS